MKKKFFIIISISLLMMSCSSNQDVRSFEAMDTFMTVKSFGKNSRTANIEVEKKVRELESYFSTTIPESDIYKLNHSESKEISVNNETYSLIDFSLNLADKTHGALNPVLYPVTSAWGFTTGNYRVPSESEIKELLLFVDFEKVQKRKTENDFFIKLEEGMMLDLGAVGKGFAGDAALEILKENKIESALLDFGGNVQALGSKPDGSCWKVGLKNPWDGSIIAALDVKDECVITSGGYERYFTADDGKKYIHIFDGKTGLPVNNEIVSTTIVCKSGAYGDALSTATFVMGVQDTIEYWMQNPDFDFIIITEEENIFYTSGIKDRLQVMYDFNAVNIVE